MPRGYLPVLLFLIAAFLFPIVTLLLARLVRPSSPGKTKLEPYECGIPAIGSARGRYTVRFYIIAILFVIFDVETILLFPWAVQYRQLGWFGFLEILIFLAILLTGYLWAWREKALEWI